MAEDVVDILIDRKLITEDVNFFAKSVEATVNIAKEGAKEHNKIAEQIRLWRESVNQISTSTNQAEFNKQFQQTTQYGNQAKQAVKEFNEIIKQEQAELQKGLNVLKQYGGSLEANVKQNIDLKNQLKEVQAELKLQQKAAELTAGANDDFATKIQDLAKQEAILKQQIFQSNTAVRQRTKEMISAEGSVDEMAAKLDQLRSAYSQLNEEERNSADGSSLLQSIAQLDEKVKRFDETQGKFQRNVGNYKGALSGLSTQLKTELSKINAELQKTGLGANEIAKLTKQAEALEVALAGVDEGFTTTKGEMRGFTEAAKQIGMQFGIASKEFQEFAKKVGSQKDELKDIQAAIDFHASDTKYVDGTLQGLSAIAGAYGAVEGAATLLGATSEEAAQIQAKLQAAIAITTGIQEVLNAIQTDGAAVQTVLAAKTGLLTLAENINAKAKALLVTTTQAQATASGEAAVAEEAQSVANIEVATTADTAAVSMGAEATATGAATKATYSFATALTATGIGAIIIAIAAAIVYVVKSIGEYNSSIENSIKANEELAGTYSNLIGALKAYDEARAISYNQFIKQEEAKAERTKALGVTAAQSLAIDMQLEQQRNAHYKAEYNRQKGAIENLNTYQEAYTNSSYYLLFLNKQREEFLTNNSGGRANKGYEDELAAIDENIKKAGDKTNSDKAMYDYLLQVKSDYADSNNRIEVLGNNLSKLNADELREYTLESAKLTSERVIAENERVLNNDLSTLKQRIDAIKSTAAEQKKIAEAENKAVQADPTISPQKKAIAERKLSNELNKITGDAKKKEFDITQDWNNRIAKAEQDKFKTLKEQQNNFYNSIIDDERLNIQQRLIAANQLNQNLIEIENNSYENELRLLNQKAVDKKEIEALEVAHNGRLSQIKLDGSNKINSIILSDKDYQKKLADEGYADLLNTYAEQENAATRAYNNEVIALNAQFTNKKISKKQYDKQLEELEYQHQIKILNIQLETARKSVNNFGDTEKAYNEALDTRKVAYEQYSNATTAQEKADAKAYLDQAEKEVAITKDANDKKRKATQDLSNAQKALSDATTQHTNKNTDKSKQKLLETLDYVKQVIDAVGGALQSIVDGNIDAQKNAIQEQIDLVDKQKEAAIASANAEAISQEEKAAKIAIINANAQAKKEALDRRQKELDNKKAKADRDFQIFNIIGNTAIAVTKFLSTGNLTQAIIAGIIGAAQLTSVLATPIPKYAKGIDSTPHDSLAWVGDGGKKEVGVTPQGDVFVTPEKPTLTYLQKGTRIYPSIQDYQMRVSDLALQNSLENGSKSIDKLQIEMAYSKVMEQQLIQTNSKLDRLESAIKNIPGVTINNTWENTQTRIKRAAGYTTYFNDFIKT